MILRSVAASTWLRTGLLLTFLNVAAGALGYVYQVLMGRLLSAEDFSLFSALMALAAICSAPLNALVMLLARRVSEFRALGEARQARGLYARTLAWLCGMGLVFAGMLAFWLPAVQAYVKAPRPLDVWLFSGATFVGFLTLVNNGFLQGLQRFAWLGGIAISGVLVKIIVSVALIAGRQAGVVGGLLGVLVSSLLVWAAGGWAIAGVLPRGCGREAVKATVFPWRCYLPATVANFSLTLLAQIDMVLVNRYFEAGQASQYAAASILGKAVLYLPGGLVLALFPFVAERHARTEDSWHMLIEATLATLVMCGAGAFFYAACGPWLVRVLYGPAYAEAGRLLAWYGFVMLPVALVTVAENFLLAKGRTLFTWIVLVLAPIEMAVIHARHPDLWAVIAVIGGSAAVLALVGFGMLWRIAAPSRWNRSASPG